MRVNLLLLSIAVLLPSTVRSASIRIEWFNGPGDELLTLGGDPLPSGTAQPDDGAILQLGFYSLATFENPFQGSWQGIGGGFVGGKGTNLPGRFDWSNTIGDNVGSPIRPPVGTPLVIRFYDSSSPDTATYFNAVSNSTGSWDWIDPTDPQTVVNLTLADPGLVWQGGPDSAFRTTIYIPEPSQFVLVSAAFLLTMLRPRRPSHSPRP